MKNKFILITSLIAFLFILLVAFRIKDRIETNKNLKNLEKQATPVTVIKPRLGEIVNSLNLTGNILSPDEVSINSKVTSRINYIYVNEGDYVKVGQILAELDHSDIDTQIAQAEAQKYVAQSNLSLQLNGPLKEQIEQAKAVLKQAEANLSQVQINYNHIQNEYYRNKKLYSEGIISKQQFDNITTQLNVSKEQLKAAREQVNNAYANFRILESGTRKEQIEIAKGQFLQAQQTINLLKVQKENYFIKAPISGVISKKHINVGALASPSSPIFTIINSSNLELVFYVPEREINKLKISQEVDVIIPALNNKKIITKIKEISPIVDPQTKLVKVKCNIKSIPNLKAGMLANCSIVFSKKTNTLILPSETVLLVNNKPVVYTVVNNVVKKNNVVLGLRTENEVEILQGLKPSDTVILEGNSFVKEQDKVVIVTNE